MHRSGGYWLTGWGRQAREEGPNVCAGGRSASDFEDDSYHTRGSGPDWTTGRRMPCRRRSLGRGGGCPRRPTGRRRGGRCPLERLVAHAVARGPSDGHCPSRQPGAARADARSVGRLRSSCAGAFGTGGQLGRHDQRGTGSGRRLGGRIDQARCALHRRRSRWQPAGRTARRIDAIRGWRGLGCTAAPPGA